MANTAYGRLTISAVTVDEIALGLAFDGCGIAVLDPFVA